MLVSASVVHIDTSKQSVFGDKCVTAVKNVHVKIISLWKSERSNRFHNYYH